ncbi:MAG: peptidylprolyl isomerase, partial [Rhodospirillales bacterium]|nr:peptidylprolyl isomerase [Rhodospirillales bacterium]
MNKQKKQPRRDFIYRSLYAVFCLFVIASPVPAQEIQNIVAVVNDDVISGYDVESRITLTLKSLGLENTTENRVEIRSKTLRNLINEKLKVQEAREHNVEVTELEIEEALANIEEANGVEKGKFREEMRNDGINPQTFIDQVESNLAWRDLINRRLRSQIDIGDDEVNEAIKEMEKNKGKPEFLLAEIFLPVESPEQEEETNRLGKQIMNHLYDGTPFQQLATQFSGSASAATGGDIGWVQPGQIDEELETEIKPMIPGQVKGPLRSVTGYHIILMREKRIIGETGEAQVSLLQLFLPLPPLASENEIDGLTEKAAVLTSDISGCDAMSELTDETGATLTNDLGTLSLGDLPENLKEAVNTLDVGTPSKPIKTSSGIMVLMVCDR